MDLKLMFDGPFEEDLTRLNLTLDEFPEEQEIKKMVNKELTLLSKQKTDE